MAPPQEARTGSLRPLSSSAARREKQTLGERHHATAAPRRRPTPRGSSPENPPRGGVCVAEPRPGKARRGRSARMRRLATRMPLSVLDAEITNPLLQHQLTSQYGAAESGLAGQPPGSEASPPSGTAQDPCAAVKPTARPLNASEGGPFAVPRQVRVTAPSKPSTATATPRLLIRAVGKLAAERRAAARGRVRHAAQLGAHRTDVAATLMPRYRGIREG